MLHKRRTLLCPRPLWQLPGRELEEVVGVAAVEEVMVKAVMAEAAVVSRTSTY